MKWKKINKQSSIIFDRQGQGLWKQTDYVSHEEDLTFFVPLSLRGNSCCHLQRATSVILIQKIEAL